MAKDRVHRVLLEIPEPWIPELKAAAEVESRSRHNLILQMIRRSLDEVAVPQGAKKIVYDERSLSRNDVTPRPKKDKS